MTTYEPFSNSLHTRYVRPIERLITIDTRFILLPVWYMPLDCLYPSVTQTRNAFFVSVLEIIVGVFSEIICGFY